MDLQMNERIRELIEKATVRGVEYRPGDNGHPTPTFYFDKEKFAELIVEECADLFVNSQYVNTKSEYYEGFNEALVYAGNKIKKHFGVEE
jgi:hypothetical protein